MVQLAFIGFLLCLSWPSAAHEHVHCDGGSQFDVARGRERLRHEVLRGLDPAALPIGPAVPDWKHGTAIGSTLRASPLRRSPSETAGAGAKGSPARRAGPAGPGPEAGARRTPTGHCGPGAAGRNAGLAGPRLTAARSLRDRASMPS